MLSDEESGGGVCDRKSATTADRGGVGDWDELELLVVASCNAVRSLTGTLPTVIRYLYNVCISVVLCVCMLLTSDVLSCT